MFQKIQNSLPQSINPLRGNIKGTKGGKCDAVVSARTRTVMRAGNAGPTVSGTPPELNEDHMDIEMLISTIIE